MGSRGQARGGVAPLLCGSRGRGARVGTKAGGALFGSGQMRESSCSLRQLSAGAWREAVEMYRVLT